VVEVFDAHSGHLDFGVRLQSSGKAGSAGATAPPGERPSEISAVGFRPDGKEIAIADAAGIWLNEARAGASPRLEHVSPGSTLEIKFTPDGARFAAAGADGAIHIWAPGTKEPLLTLRGCGSDPMAFDFARDGAICIGRDGSVHLWRTTSTHDPEAKKAVRIACNPGVGICQ
jgi:WD40 repeat protein